MSEARASGLSEGECLGLAAEAAPAPQIWTAPADHPRAPVGMDPDRENRRADVPIGVPMLSATHSHVAGRTASAQQTPLFAALSDAPRETRTPTPLTQDKALNLEARVYVLVRSRALRPFCPPAWTSWKHRTRRPLPARCHGRRSSGRRVPGPGLRHRRLPGRGTSFPVARCVFRRLADDFRIRRRSGSLRRIDQRYRTTSSAAGAVRRMARTPASVRRRASPNQAYGTPQFRRSAYGRRRSLAIPLAVRPAERWFRAGGAAQLHGRRQRALTTSTSGTPTDVAQGHERLAEADLRA
jgi:hypothetical protein